MNTSHCMADRTAGAEETAATETAGKEWPQRDKCANQIKKCNSTCRERERDEQAYEHHV